MPKVTFKAKPQIIYNMDDTEDYRRIKVPDITRSHCDMPAFRSHPKFSAYANSDLFPAMLRRRLEAMRIGEYLRLDKKLPDGVSVDTTGFLARVTIDVEA